MGADPGPRLPLIIAAACLAAVLAVAGLVRLGLLLGG